MGNSIRQVNLKTLAATTLLGPGERPYVLQSVGRQASVNRPSGLAYDSVTKALYVADTWAGAILKVD